MEGVWKELKELKAHVSILNKENGDNKAKILVLETQLSASEKKVQELEGKANKYDRHFKALERKVVDLEQKQKQQKQLQQQQIQDANERFTRLDKLHHLLSAAILKAATGRQRENKIEQIRSQLNSVHEAVDDLTVGTDTLSSQMASLKYNVSCIEDSNFHFVSRLNASERKAERLKEGLKDTKKKINSLESKTSALETMITDDDSDSRLNALETKGKCFEDDLKDIKREVKSSMDVISSLEISRDTVMETVFCVDLETSKGFITKVLTKLDHCQTLHLNSQCFDRKNAFFIAPIDGIYLFYITMSLSGTGDLLVAVRPENGFIYHVASSFLRNGWTDKSCDIQSGSVIMPLCKGEQIGVYVERFQGEAEVAFCRFGGCLLSSIV